MQVNECIDCPDKQVNIRWTTVGEIAIYSKTRISTSELNANSYVGIENLLPDMRGKTISNHIPTSGTVISYKPDDILIGNFRPYLKKIWFANSYGGANQHVLVVRIKERERIALMPRFLYYILASDDFFVYDVQHAKGFMMPHGDKKAIMKYSIPVSPPLPVQQEIVNILDRFSKLEAELEARRRQYAYYRDSLMATVVV